MLAVEARTLPHYLVLGDVKHDGFHRFFRSNDPVSIINEQGLLYAYEVTPYKGEYANLPYELPAPMPGGQGGGETIFILLQNRVGQGEYSKRWVSLFLLLLLLLSSSSSSSSSSLPPLSPLFILSSSSFSFSSLPLLFLLLLLLFLFSSSSSSSSVISPYMIYMYMCVCI